MTGNTSSIELGLLKVNEAGGVILMDSSLHIIAYDRGAAAILGMPEHTAPANRHSVPIPQEIQNIIDGKDISELHSHVTRLHTQNGHFSCTSYLMAPQNGVLSQPVLVLHLDRAISTLDVIDKVATKYRLTEREQEALKGIALGLTSKELADRMHISPNTVKAFLRLIMIKMSVTTRSGIVGKILQNKHDALNAN